MIFHQWLIPQDQLIEKVSQFRNAMVQDAQSRGMTINRGVEKVTEADLDRGIIARTATDSLPDLIQLSEELYHQLWQPFQEHII